MATMTSQQLRDYEARMFGVGRHCDHNKPVEDESTLQDSIVAECRRRGWFVVFSGMHRKTSTPIGTPDFIIYADKGTVFTVETKSKTGKQTPEQMGVQMMLDKLGHRYCLVRSFGEFMMVIDQSPKIPDTSGD
jgi:hypothetical protein